MTRIYPRASLANKICADASPSGETSGEREPRRACRDSVLNSTGRHAAAITPPLRASQARWWSASPNVVPIAVSRLK